MLADMTFLLQLRSRPVSKTVFLKKNSDLFDKYKDTLTLVHDENLENSIKQEMQQSRLCEGIGSNETDDFKTNKMCLFKKR